jgi:predicted HTH transcriptional regulator
MMEKNGEEETYVVLESHLISKKAVDILLREKFEKEDYYEFLEERKNTIIKAIEELILNKTEEITNIDYSAIIDGGENESLEFKSTFYFNKNENKPDKSMKMAVIKTIAGFLNTAGGRLLVGVEDNGNIFGLEKDYEVNFRKDRDGFLQDFRTTLNQFFDDGTIQRHIFYKIEVIREKEILVVNIEKSREAIFLKKEQQKILYVRRGNKTDNLTDVEDIHRYITDNWKR